MKFGAKPVISPAYLQKTDFPKITDTVNVAKILEPKELL
jgi:hypothetical protein